VFSLPKMGLGSRSIKVNGADVGTEAIALGVMTSIGGFLFGYDTGQISAMQTFTDFVNRFAQLQPDGTRAWNSYILALVVSLMSIGSLIGALLGSYSSDWLGRRRNLSWGVFVFVVGNIIQITAMNSWVHLMIGRLVAGVGVGILSVGVPLMQSECVPKEIRGAVVASYQLMITIGILVANGINMGVRSIQDSDASWRIVIGLGIAFSLPLGIGILFVPESPRFLASKGRWEEAQTALARLRGLKDDQDNELVMVDFREMKMILEKENKVGTGTWLECFTSKSPKVVYRTYLGMAIHFLQQWTGVNYFFYYGATIFQSAGVDDPILVALILGAVNVVCTFPGLWFVERFGRRMPLFLGGLWQCAWLVIFAAIGTALPPTENRAAGIVMIVAACMFIASFACSWGPFAWVVIGESFPLRTRSKQASLATAANWLGNWMIAFCSPIADRGIGYNFGFVFAGCNLAGATIVWFFLYESKQLSLEAVDEMYSVEDLKPWQSSQWIPAGYLSRRERDPRYLREDDDDLTRVGSDELITSDKNKNRTSEARIEKASNQVV